MYATVSFPINTHMVNRNDASFYLEALDELHDKYHGRYCSIKLTGRLRDKYDALDILSTIGFKSSKSAKGWYLKEWHGYTEIYNDVYELFLTQRGDIND